MDTQHARPSAPAYTAPVLSGTAIAAALATLAEWVTDGTIDLAARYCPGQALDIHIGMASADAVREFAARVAVDVEVSGEHTWASVPLGTGIDSEGHLCYTSAVLLRVSHVGEAAIAAAVAAAKGAE